MTAIDTFYAMPFPTYDELEHFVLYDVPARCVGRNLPTLMWAAELCPNNHVLLKRIFDCRMDKTVVRKVGEEINKRGGMQAMVANFYIYCHFVGERLKDMNVVQKQWNKLHFDHAKLIEHLWDGVGQWRA